MRHVVNHSGLSVYLKSDLIDREKPRLNGSAQPISCRSRHHTRCSPWIITVLSTFAII